MPATTIGRPSIVPVPCSAPVLVSLFFCACGDPLDVGLGVGEGERVEDLEVAAQLLEAALVEQLARGARGCAGGSGGCSRGTRRGCGAGACGRRTPRTRGSETTPPSRRGWLWRAQPRRSSEARRRSSACMRRYSDSDALSAASTSSRVGACSAGSPACAWRKAIRLTVRPCGSLTGASRASSSARWPILARELRSRSSRAAGRSRGPGTSSSSRRRSNAASASSSCADLEAELGDVERGHQIVGLGLGDPLRLRQRLLVAGRACGTCRRG